LFSNHKRWEDVNYEEYKEKQTIPEVLDHSMEVASENQNIENEEVFSFSITQKERSIIAKEDSTTQKIFESL
jgi:hypothetical protein